MHQNCSSGNEARAPGPNTRRRQRLPQRLASLPLLGQHPALVNTEDYHEVDPNGLAETLLAFGEVFLQQASPGQRQVVRTRGACQQLVGKRHVNKLQGNSTPARLGEQAHHGHPQDAAPALQTRFRRTASCPFEFHEQETDRRFFPPPLKNYLPLLVGLFCFKQLFLPCKTKADSIMWQSEKPHRDDCGGQEHPTGERNCSDIHKCLREERSAGVQEAQEARMHLISDRTRARCSLHSQQCRAETLRELCLPEVTLSSSSILVLALRLALVLHFWPVVLLSWHLG